MSFGSPIVVSEGEQQRRFVSLAGISARRDDPNSFNESLLQELIDATPNVLPVREYLPSTTTLFSLGREVPVDLGVNNGYIDNLLVTNDGYLVIVETKHHLPARRKILALSVLAESVSSWFFLSSPLDLTPTLRGSGKGEEPSGEKTSA